MDADRFYGLIRSLSVAGTRRAAVRALAGGAVGVSLSRIATAGAAANCRPLGHKCDKRHGGKCCNGGQCRNGDCQCPAESFEVNGGCFFEGSCSPDVAICVFRCGNARGRGGHDGCFCGVTVEHLGLCFRNGRLCERTCQSSADCPTGQACFESDCGSPAGTCLGPCPGKRLVA